MIVKPLLNLFGRFAVGFLSVSLLMGMVIVLNPKESKYTIYAAEKTYHCNQFVVTGRTIYFKDVNGKNVCINGEYTLIYETKDTTK